MSKYILLFSYIATMNASITNYMRVKNFTNINNNYWTQERKDNTVRFVSNIYPNHLLTGSLDPFVLPSNYDEIDCPAGWQNDAVNQTCTLPASGGDYSRSFEWYGYIYFATYTSGKCPALTSWDGANCSTPVYYGYENIRPASLNNGSYTIPYPKFTSSTINTNNRPDWNLGILYFTATLDDNTTVNAYCNAVVISPTVVMTSAHCVEMNGTAFKNLSFQSTRGTASVSKAVWNKFFDVSTNLNRIRYDYAFLKLNNSVTPGNVGVTFSLGMDNTSNLNDMAMYLSQVDNNRYTSPLLPNATFDGVYTFRYNIPVATGGEAIIRNYNNSSQVLSGTNSLISIISCSVRDGLSGNSIAYAPILDGYAYSLYVSVIS